MPVPVAYKQNHEKIDWFSPGFSTDLQSVLRSDGLLMRQVLSMEMPAQPSSIFKIIPEQNHEDK